VGKLGWGKAWQLASTTTLDQLESEMLKLPGVRQTMDNYHQSYQQFQRDLDAHSARVQDFEDSDPWVTASAALGSATREAKTALVDRYIKDYPKFDSVDESRRAVLSRCFDPKSVISASDWQLVQPLLDDIAPLLILKVKSAEATLAQVQATRPAEPVEPKPVYIEEVYLSALAQAPSDAPPAVLGLPVQPQAVLPPHMEAVAQMA
jgi:hypothetical protein